METQIFHSAKNIIFQKSSKRNQNPSRYYNSITNLEFQHKAKYHLFIYLFIYLFIKKTSFKNPHIKI